jgi:hypothetical protein
MLFYVETRAVRRKPGILLKISPSFSGQKVNVNDIPTEADIKPREPRMVN